MPFNFKDFEKNVQKEFTRRERDYGVVVSPDIAEHRGGRTPWIRVASGVVYGPPDQIPAIEDETESTLCSQQNKQKRNQPSNLIQSEGLVLEPNISNFKNFYGMDGEDEPQFIAKRIKSAGMHDTITALNPRNQPGPIIENITVESKGDMGLTRTAQFTWKAFTQTQFDILSDFFCVAGKTAVLEWGWHTFFTTGNGLSETLDLTDTNYIRNIASGKTFGKLFANNAITEATTQSGPVFDYNAVVQQPHTATQNLYTRLLETMSDIEAASYTPYEALMLLGNNDYDLFIGTITSYDININDGIYEVTVNMLAIGESFLNLGNNESGLTKYFNNTPDSKFRKFLKENKDKDPRIWVKDVVDTTKHKKSTGGSEPVEVPINYDYSPQERQKLAEVSDVFFDVDPLYYGIDGFVSAIDRENRGDVRVASILDKAPNVRNLWTPAFFGKHITVYTYVTDKVIMDLFTRFAKLVVNYENLFPETDKFFKGDYWKAHRVFLRHCYNMTFALNGGEIPKRDAVDSVLSQIDGIASPFVKRVFEGMGQTAAGQDATVHITTFWNTPNLLNVIRYYLEIAYRRDNSSTIGIGGPLTDNQLTILSDNFPSSNVMSYVMSDIEPAVKTVRGYLYLSLGVSKEIALAQIGNYIKTMLNPFTTATSAIELKGYKHPVDISNNRGGWGEDAISFIVAALRVQQNTYNGILTDEVDDLGSFPSLDFGGSLLDSDGAIKEESDYSYITYGLLEEIINTEIFGSRVKNPILDSRETYLQFHKNQVSSDKSTCILPNSAAPRYNLDNINEIVDSTLETIDLSINGISHNKYPNLPTKIVYGSDGAGGQMEVQLNSPSPVNECGMGEMYLYSLFINTELIQRIFSTAKDLYDAIIEILGYINGALGRRYDLKLERRGNSAQVFDFTNQKSAQYSGLYVFPYNTNNSFIKGIDISLSVADQAAIQAIMARDTEEAKAQSILTGNTATDDLYKLDVERYNTKQDEAEPEPVNIPVSAPACFHHKAYNGTRGSTGFSIDSMSGPLVNFVYPHQDTIDLNTVGDSDNETFPVPNAELSITIDGLSGIHFFNVFNVWFIPRRFRQVGRFFVKGLNHTITPESWELTIDSQYMIVPTRFWGIDASLDTEEQEREGVIILEDKPMPVGLMTDGGNTLSNTIFTDQNN